MWRLLAGRAGKAGGGIMAETRALLGQQHRQQHQLAQAAQSLPSQSQIMLELSRLEGQLNKSSMRDGTKRQAFSLKSLPFPLNPHAVEQGLHTITVHARAVEGKHTCRWLRKIYNHHGTTLFRRPGQTGRTPARIHSLPGNRSLLLHMPTPEADRLVSNFGRNGCQARIIALKIVHPDHPEHVLATVRAKPGMVHMKPTRNIVENIDFLFCPQDRVVNVNVPIKLVNDETCVGVRKGGWVQIVRRTVHYQAMGNAVPAFIEVDVKGLDLDQVLRVRDLPIPPGTRLPIQDYDRAVLTCSAGAGRD